ncbi:MAG: ABC transporter [Planctomycetes bacterium RBG_13_60_9]|nr:MAG: ABC transporter [Planctomycetes bacterium RBG_13_60_9]
MRSSSPVAFPTLRQRLFSVWYRHVRVYTKNLISNGLPPFLEPVLFLLGVGMGLGTYIQESMEGLKYIDFLGTGLLVTAAMFTSAYECTFGTFIRLEFEKVYDGMLAAPITVNNLIVGEILWAGTKGLFFTFAVMCILTLFRIIHLPQGLLAPPVGFLTGLMFGTLSLWVTSYVKTINHFNFYLTGVISPMFFFSGVVFPVSRLPSSVRFIAEVVPLTHAVRLARAVCTSRYHLSQLGDLAYIAVFIVVMGLLAIRRLRNRLIT